MEIISHDCHDVLSRDGEDYDKKKNELTNNNEEDDQLPFVYISAGTQRYHDAF